MTESEAKTILERDLNCLKQNKALPDSIEATEIAINALEKQIAKKPKNRYKTRYIWDSAYCPICNCGITARWVYCQCCGQKLDWSDEK